MKQHCVKCLEEKDTSEFYKNSINKSGYDGKCKQCKRDYAKWYRENVQDKNKNRDYQRGWQSSYRKENLHKVYANTKRWIDKNREKQQASNMINQGIKMGRIKRQPCEVCGELKSHGHHNDYTKPLEVIWLCALHHKEIHREERMYARTA